MLFDDAEVIRKPDKTCASCSHLLKETFRSGRSLFFCTVQKGGMYGKKIKKNAPSCRLHNQNDEDEI